MKLLVIAPYPRDRAPSQRFRFEQYLPRLRDDGVDVSLRPLLDRETYRRFHRSGGIPGKTLALLRGLVHRIRDVTRASEHDVVLLHREAYPAGGAFLERRLARRGTPLVFDFDDAIFRRDVSPANRWAGFLKRPGKTREIVRLADVVLAGNRYLARFAEDEGAGDVRVLPTVIDTDEYRCPEATADGAATHVTVGWTGSLTTIAHFRRLEGVLRRLQGETGVGVRVVGDPTYRPEGFDADVLPWRPGTEVADLCPIDIGVMPLPDEEWARGKCGLKLLQYMALGRPAVASPVGVNTEIVRHGENGLLADGEEEWYRALRRLAGDPGLRRRLGREARRTVVERYSVDSTYADFAGALRDAAGTREAG